MLRNYWETIVDLVYPTNCIICKKHLGSRKTDLICADCLNRAENNLPPFCAKCGGNLKDKEQEKGICSSCRDKNFCFKRAWSVTLYKGIMEDLIHMFKYQNKPQLAKPLSRMMIDFMETYNLALKGFDWVVGVPLHSSKLREREYNQAQLLAENIAEYFAIPVSKGNLQRCKPTPPQSSLTPEKRWNNVANAFTLKEPEQFKDKRILLVDDLLTTGATCSEIAKTLNQAQASCVFTLTLSIAR